MVYSLSLSLSLYTYIYIYICLTLLTVTLFLPPLQILSGSHLIQKAFVGGSASNPPPAAEWYSLRGGKAPINRLPRPSESSLMLKDGFCPAPSVTKFKKQLRCRHHFTIFYSPDGTESKTIPACFEGLEIPAAEELHPGLFFF